MKGSKRLLWICELVIVQKTRYGFNYVYSSFDSTWEDTTTRDDDITCPRSSWGSLCPENS